MESSISLEETNKIRISLGLKPLVDDGAPVDVKEKTAENNYVETREREKAEKRTRFVYYARNSHSTGSPIDHRVRSYVPFLLVN